jgi:hypothetical protein
MNIIKRLVEEHKEMKQIAKEMRQEELLEKFKDWQEFHHVNDEELLFFDYMYRRERKYRTAILILCLIILGLTLSLLM